MQAKWGAKGSLIEEMRRAVRECRVIMPKAATSFMPVEAGKRKADEAEDSKKKRTEEPIELTPYLNEILQKTFLLWMPDAQVLASFQQVSFLDIKNFCDSNPILAFRFLNGPEPTDEGELQIVRYKQLKPTTYVFEMLLERDYGLSGLPEKCNAPTLSLRDLVATSFDRHFPDLEKRSFNSKMIEKLAVVHNILETQRAVDLTHPSGRGSLPGDDFSDWQCVANNLVFELHPTKGLRVSPLLSIILLETYGEPFNYVSMADEEWWNIYRFALGRSDGSYYRKFGTWTDLGFLAGANNMQVTTIGGVIVQMYFPGAGGVVFGRESITSLRFGEILTFVGPPQGANADMFGGYTDLTKKRTDEASYCTSAVRDKLHPHVRLISKNDSGNLVFRDVDIDHGRLFFPNRANYKKKTINPLVVDYEMLAWARSIELDREDNDADDFAENDLNKLGDMLWWVIAYRKVLQDYDFPLEDPSACKVPFRYDWGYKELYGTTVARLSKFGEQFSAAVIVGFKSKTLSNRNLFEIVVVGSEDWDEVPSVKRRVRFNTRTVNLSDSASRATAFNATGHGEVLRIELDGALLVIDFQNNTVREYANILRSLVVANDGHNFAINDDDDASYELLTATYKMDTVVTLVE